MGYSLSLTLQLKKKKSNREYVQENYRTIQIRKPTLKGAVYRLTQLRNQHKNTRLKKPKTSGKGNLLINLGMPTGWQLGLWELRH